MKNVVVDLKEYRQNKKMKEWIDELDQIAESHYQNMSPEEKRGYENFMKLVKAVDKKATEEQEPKE